MVKFITFSFFLLCSSCMGQTPNAGSTDFIRIDHSGPIDKPIRSLIISTQKVPSSVRELSIQVDEEVFALLAEIVEKSNDLRSSREVDEFGVFRITQVINENSKILFTSTRNGSITFFKEIKKNLESVPGASVLSSEIDKILVRIDY